MIFILNCYNLMAALSPLAYSYKGQRVKANFLATFHFKILHEINFSETYSLSSSLLIRVMFYAVALDEDMCPIQKDVY